MSLLDKSLKLALFASITVSLAGCSDGSKDTGTTGDADTDADGDTDADADGDTDTDTDTDTTPSTETGIALLWWHSEAEVSGDTFQSGKWGTLFTDLADLTTGNIGPALCDNTGDWVQSGDAPAGCPDCAWAFGLTVENTGAVGDYCADFGRSGGDWDGFDHPFGWAATYEYVYGTYTFDLEKVLFYYYGGGGYWFFLSYNYGGYGYNTGDASSMTTDRNYAYYYFYP